MCAADLICKPKSMHCYEGVQLISLRKEGRGREAWGASFYSQVSPDGYCCGSLMHSGRYCLDGGHS